MICTVLYCVQSEEMILPAVSGFQNAGRISLKLDKVGSNESGAGVKYLI